MKTRPKGRFGQQLRTVFNLGSIGDLTDGQLLERFATRGGEAAELAFAALVERHGPMVLRVCRHALVEVHDAEDAFQATFLILVKQARSLWVQDSLGPWLHRVAHRVAVRARSSAARVREHERCAAEARPDLLKETRDWDEVVQHLHEEIDRLPERYRVPVVLCDLEGLTHEKAARHLGWPVGTLKTRLARARELLRSRLCGRGLGVPERPFAADKRLAMVLPFGAQGAALPAALVESTSRAAGLVAAGQPLSGSVISSGVATPRVKRQPHQAQHPAEPPRLQEIRPLDPGVGPAISQRSPGRARHPIRSTTRPPRHRHHPQIDRSPQLCAAQIFPSEAVKP